MAIPIAMRAKYHEVMNITEMQSVSPIKDSDQW